MDIEEKRQNALQHLLVAKQTREFIPFFYTVKTAADEQVCPICREYEGKKFDVLEAIPGINYPPFDGCTCGHCRCYASFSAE